jgi:hypothetical protein
LLVFLHVKCRVKHLADRLDRCRVELPLCLASPYPAVLGRHEQCRKEVTTLLWQVGHGAALVPGPASAPHAQPKVRPRPRLVRRGTRWSSPSEGRTPSSRSVQSGQGCCKHSCSLFMPARQRGSEQAREGIGRGTCRAGEQAGRHPLCADQIKWRGPCAGRFHQARTAT